METSTIFLISLAIFGWGVGTYFDKLAVGIIGPKTVFVVYLSAGIMTLLYFLLAGEALPLGPQKGILMALIAGTLISIGGIGFYTALQKENVSLIVPFAALYPAITVILGVMLLHEKIKLVNAAGIVLAIIAGVLLAL